jgi:hypothetical protein
MLVAGHDADSARASQALLPAIRLAPASRAGA